MAGHSKWSKVKHIKAVVDVRRGRVFSRLSKEITVAARLGGGNPDFNPRLRAAVQSARDQSMPNDNIERAIKKGTGEMASRAVEEILYEGYGPDGVAIMVETATDNRNRTAAELRMIFGKHGGNLGSSGSVAFLFHRCGQIRLDASVVDENRLLEILLEAGAEELTREDEDTFLITTPPEAFMAIATAIRQADLPIAEQKLTFQPQTLAAASSETTAQVLKLLDALEDNEDVLSVHSNLEPVGEPAEPAVCPPLLPRNFTISQFERSQHE